MLYQKPAHIETILKNLPAKPGVYLLKNAKGKVIYVGKAKRLRNRVRSYFTTQADGNSKTLRMRGLVADIDFIITENEVKALILEETLIKKHIVRASISSSRTTSATPISASAGATPFPKWKPRAASSMTARAISDPIPPCGWCRRRCGTCAKPSPI